MKVRVLTWLLLISLAGGASYAGSKPPKPRYHCICGDICAKAAPCERCGVKRCDGKDVRRIKSGEGNPR